MARIHISIVDIRSAFNVYANVIAAPHKRAIVNVMAKFSDNILGGTVIRIINTVDIDTAVRKVHNYKFFHKLFYLKILIRK